MKFLKSLFLPFGLPFDNQPTPRLRWSGIQTCPANLYAKTGRMAYIKTDYPECRVKRGVSKGLLKITLIFLITYPTLLFPTNFNVGKKTSTVEIKNGASFVTDSQITNYKGRLIKENGASVSGEDFVFDEGTFEDSGTKLSLTGNLSLGQLNKILLGGGKTFKGTRGDILQSIHVSGNGNRIEGVFQLRDDMTIQDNATTVTFAMVGRMPKNIIMNGGTVNLEEDLHFVDDMFFTGSGVVCLNNRNLHLGSKEMTVNASIYFDQAEDIEFHANTHLASTWTFSHNCIMEGNGKILYLEDGGNIVVECGSRLLMRDMTVFGVTGNNIRCLDCCASFSMQNVIWILSSNYSFTKGAFELIDDFRVKGGNTFAYQTTRTSTVGSNARMIFEESTTFSFDPILDSAFSVTTAKNLINFTDATSRLVFSASDLYVTKTGLQLTKGTLEFKGDCNVYSDASNNWEGIIFGDGSSADNDLNIDVLPDAHLSLYSGHIWNRNVNS